MQARRFHWPLFMLAVCCALLVDATIVAGDAAKKLRLVDLAGRDVQPFAAPPAKATVFLFVRTDCPISNSYAPEMQRLYTRFTPKEVSFWLVYLDPDESSAAIRTHQKDFGLTLPTLRDSRHGLVDLCGARVTPEAAVFSPSGKKVYVGRIDDRFSSLGKSKAQPSTRDLEAAITATLAGGLPAKTTALAVGCPIADLR